MVATKADQTVHCWVAQMVVGLVGLWDRLWAGQRVVLMVSMKVGRLVVQKVDKTAVSWVAWWAAVLAAR
jgi:hypothetical protein